MKQFEGNSRHDKEVQGDDFRGVILEECLLGLSGCSLGFLGQVSQHGRF